MKDLVCKLKKDEKVLNKYREHLKPELLEILDHIDMHINRELFNVDKLQNFKLAEGVFSLTMYARYIGKSVKSLAKQARDCGYTVEVDRNRKYDKRRYHTCILMK